MSKLWDEQTVGEQTVGEHAQPGTGAGMSTRIELVIGIWITALFTLWGLGLAIVRHRWSNAPARAAAAPCQTIAQDPQPPLNVRSRPTVTPHNIVGTITNGTPLVVAAQQPGWLRINAPIAGWVYQPLTRQDCRGAQSTGLKPRQPLKIVSLNVIDQAQERFQAGHLQAAQAMLQTIPAADFTYPQAQAALQTMTTQWQQGDRAYKTAQQAIAAGRWQTVLTTVPQVPDIRYWRGKMAPIVKRAIYQQAQQKTS
jgi:Bacterial SH3 domain